jgi:hypothetical protein
VWAVLVGQGMECRFGLMPPAVSHWVVVCLAVDVEEVVDGLLCRVDPCLQVSCAF